ncbi:MAG: phosphoribosylformylglycinamidine synthase subunit PurS [Endomicrobium sp.]|jgi:phosphoribosylformylglycinamidine synthase|nr:phosphoribosylformylglycinamidine synthase subunit PurS [Endomicrobium sp.]
MFGIEIFTKTKYKDSRGEHVLSDINSSGVSKGVKKVKYCSLYIVDGNLSLNEIRMIASCLLSDNITEGYKITKYGSKNSKSYLNNIFVSKAMIEVVYKKGVTDTVSSSVVKAVKDLGINKDIKVKTGHRYYLSGKLSKTILDTIACKLLSNTLIQEYKIKSVK